MRLRPDFDHAGFEVLSEPSRQESASIVETLKGIIKGKPGLNQQRLIEASGLAEHRGRQILQDGENRHWKVEPRDRKTKAYFPIDQL
jgi:hypothetical protein